MTDEEIVTGIQRKDQKAFEELVNTYGSFIKAVVTYHMSAFSKYNDDCINDALMAIWQNIQSYDHTKNTLKNWIGAICKYKAIDFKRKYSKDFLTDELDENIISKAEKELDIEINELLQNLNSEDRDIFYRHYILGEKVCDIAKSKNKSENSCHSRLSRGRQKLRKLWSVIYNEK